MTWASLWWRVCLLARLHARRVRVRWLLWRRSRRALRLGRLGAPLSETAQLKAAHYSVVNGSGAFTVSGMVTSPDRTGFVMGSEPGDIAYVSHGSAAYGAWLPGARPGETIFGNRIASNYRDFAAAQAREILDQHEAMLQEQRDAMLKVES